MKITPNFNRREFDRHEEIEPGSALWDRMVEHLGHVQRIRDEVGVPVSISAHGGYHGPHFDKHWRKRRATSQHRKACATDLRAKGLSPKQLHTIILRLIREGAISEGGVGLYDGPGGYVHFDSRGTRARWSGSP